jgi:DNA polymerase III delta subunit
MVISGSDEFLRERELSRSRKAATKTQRRWTRLSDGDNAGLDAILSLSTFVEERTLVVLDVKASKSAWGDRIGDTVLRHHASGDDDVALVVVCLGAVPKDSWVAKVVSAIGKGRHLAWDAPKPWEEREAASKFLRAEVSRLGATIPEDLAELTVISAGSDRWMMVQEALKLATLLKSEGRDTVTRSDVNAVVAPLSGGHWDDLTTAVANGDRRATIRALTTLRHGPDGGDTPMGACVILSNAIVRWLHAASAFGKDVSDDDVASRVGIHPFIFKKTVAPVARRWGKENLTLLLRDVVAVERAIKRGVVNPWVGLEAALLRHCAGLGLTR